MESTSLPSLPTALFSMYLLSFLFPILLLSRPALFLQRDTMVVALWGEQAESFDAEHYMEMATREPVILLFVAVTASLFNGALLLLSQ
jgi:hypothetical protein